MTDGTYNLYFPEGGFYRFTKPNGMAEFRLTRVEDIFANWMSINWQSVTVAGAPSVRVASVTEGARDDQGSTRGLTFSYNDPNSINPNTITDPYGRSARFTYQAIMLKTRLNDPDDLAVGPSYNTVVLATAEDMNGWMTRYSYEGNYGDILRVEVAPSQAALAANTNVRKWTFGIFNLQDSTGTNITRKELPALKISDPLGAAEEFYYNAQHTNGGGGVHISKDAMALGTSTNPPKQELYTFTPVGDESRVSSITRPSTDLQPGAQETTSFSYSGAFLSSIAPSDGSGTYSTPNAYGLPMGAQFSLSGGGGGLVHYDYGTFVNTARGAAFPDLTQITDSNNKVVAKIYWNTLHQPTDIYYGPTASDTSGIPTTFLSRVHTNYALWGAPTSQTVTSPSALISSTYWNYDAKHRLGSITADAVEGNTNAKKLVAFGYETAVPYRLAATQDDRGIVTNYSYDNFDRVTRIGYFDSSQELFTYCSVCGALLTQTGRDGKTTTFTPDAMGRTTQVNYPDGRTMKMGYWPSGLLRSVVDQANRATTWTYDEMGRLSSKRMPNAKEKLYSWRNGHIVSQRLPLRADGSARVINSQYEFGFLTQLSSQNQLSNGAFQNEDLTYRYVYDNNGRLQSTNDNQNAPWSTNSLDYDVLGRPILDEQGQYNESAVVRTGYNAAGDASGQSITDRAGNLRDGYSQTFSFDSLGRTVNNNTPVGRFTSAYNAGDFSDLQASITWPGTGGRTDFGYDNFGRSTSVVYKRGDLNSLYAQHYPVYDQGTLNNGVRTARDVMTLVGRQLRDPGEVLDGGENISYGYEANADRLISEDSNVGASFPTSNRFAYDVADNRSSVWQPLQNRRTDYAYPNSTNNPTNALTFTRTSTTNASGTATATQKQLWYEYDENGNITATSSTSSVVSHFLYNANTGRATKVYDNANAIYTYDSFDRLTSVTLCSPSTDDPNVYPYKKGCVPYQHTLFAYDGQNRRVWTQEATGTPNWRPDTYPDNNTDAYYHADWTPTKTRRTIYSGMTPIQERDENNVTQTQLYWGDNGLMARRVKNGTGWRDYFVTSDSFGSVAQIIRADTGSIVARYTYDAYGNTIKQMPEVDGVWYGIRVDPI